MFKEDYSTTFTSDTYSKVTPADSNKSGLVNRGKYSIKSFVIADFRTAEKGYGVNRLYTSVLISLGAMSFILITYGLQSGFEFYGVT